MLLEALLIGLVKSLGAHIAPEEKRLAFPAALPHVRREFILLQVGRVHEPLQRYFVELRSLLCFSPCACI